MSINNPYVPGDPYSYDLKWLVARIKEHTVQIEQLTTEMDELEDLAGIIQQMIDSGVLYYVTPQMYGAKGDGVTDDTQAIQRCIDDGNYYVNMGGHTYLISDTIEVKDKIILCNGTLKCDSNITTGMLAVMSDDVVLHHLTMIGANIGIDPPDTGYDNYAIICRTDVKNVVIDTCEISQTTGGGIFFSAGSNVIITSNYIHDIPARTGSDIAYGYGINSTEMKTALIANNICDGECRFGIHVQGWPHDVLITGNTVNEHYGYGIMAYDYSDGTHHISDVVISDNIVRNTHNSTVLTYDGMGIYAQTVYGVTITGNQVYNSLIDRPDVASPNRTLPPAAISINHSSPATCIGNIVDGSLIDGIDCPATSPSGETHTISGNVIRNVGVNGIWGRPIQNAAITGNTIEMSSGKNAISIESAPGYDAENVTVTGNVIKGSMVNGIDMQKATGTALYCMTVMNNDVSGFTATGLNFVDIYDMNLSGNMVRRTDTPVTNAYGIALNRVENFIMSANILCEDGTHTNPRGIVVTNSINGMIIGNIVTHVDQASYELAQGSNTDVHTYVNKTPRGTLPFIGPLEFGNNMMTDPNRQLLFDTAAPSSGYHQRGSIVLNTTPSAGGYAGWICTAAGTPGTWKGFGTIAS